MKLRYARFGYMPSIIHEQIVNVLSNDWMSLDVGWIFESKDPVCLMLAGIGGSRLICWLQMEAGEESISRIS